MYTKYRLSLYDLVYQVVQWSSYYDVVPSISQHFSIIMTGTNIVTQIILNLNNN